MPAIEIPKAVPAGVAGVMVVRTPESMFAAVASFDLLGEVESDDIDQLQQELDDYLGEQLGVTLTEVDAVVGFFVPDKGVAAVIEGTTGNPKGRTVGEHEGVPLIAFDGDNLVAASLDERLILGQRAAVELALSAAAGNAKTLRDEGGELVDLLTKKSRGVTLAAVVSVSRLPDDLRDQATPLGIEHALLRYGSDGIEVVATESDDAMKALASQVEGGLAMLSSEARRAKERAIERDDVLEGIGTIFADHSARRLSKLLEPDLEGTQLRLRVPLKLQDPALLTALAGIGAAIAVPALTKYTRRAKTSEARVQIAKMFDAASAYFNEEHVDSRALEVGLDDPLTTANDRDITTITRIEPRLLDHQRIPAAEGLIGHHGAQVAHHGPADVELLEHLVQLYPLEARERVAAEPYRAQRGPGREAIDPREHGVAGDEHLDQ